MARVELRGVRKDFGRVRVIRGVDLVVEHGELVVFVGPSGCGKSTLLRLIAGLEEASAGDILIDGEVVTQRPPAKRGIAMVFQSYALYPHMDVYRNMAFGLELAKVGRAEADAKVRAAARMLRIDGLLERKPRELSGGQRQRVAIGRAIVRDPKVFLFDEPLSNLDAALRVQTRIELAKLHAETGATMIYVTHDQVEAMTLADRIVVLDEGRVEQVGAPLELYHRPANLFVATFIGSPRMNVLETRVAAVEEGAARVDLPGGASLALPLGEGVDPGERVHLGVRPEHLGLGAPADARLPARVELVEQLGESHLVHAALPDGAMLTLRAPGDGALRPGEGVEIGLEARSCHLFAADGRALRRRGE